MSEHRCEYKNCSEYAKYELFWESYDEEGIPSEPDSNNWALSCESHLVDIVKNHEFVPPVDDVFLLSEYKFLPKLANSINIAINRCYMHRAIM